MCHVGTCQGKEYFFTCEALSLVDPTAYTPGSGEQFLLLSLDTRACTSRAEERGSLRPLPVFWAVSTVSQYAIGY